MRVLLVDHDSEGLEAIARAIRGVLELDCVSSKGDAMLLLRQNTYDVLIACERCVDGSGLDLLGRTTRTAAPLKRIFAAPADRLQLLGPRLAPFKVQRTISYPIDLEELWLAIAQVTGTQDDTDGTIERVVLDERGIPSSGTTPRGPIPPRPPAPLREVRAAPAAAPVAVPAPIAAPAVAVAGAAASVPRAAPPVTEVPLTPVARTAPPAPPLSAADTGRMRVLPISDTSRMRALAQAPQPPQPPPVELPGWTPEPPREDEFVSLAAQARMGLGTDHKLVDEAARRKRQRLITACAAATVVAGVLAVLIQKFYDPEARARDEAIAATVAKMTEQQKVTENLMLIEIDIEKAIMENKLDVARQELAKLVERSPQHPRREFLQASIDRAAELARLAPQTETPAAAVAVAAPANSAGSAQPERAAARPRPVEREPERVAAATPDRAGSRTQRDAAPAAAGTSQQNRTFGAPIGETVRRTIPLNAPINAEPTVTNRPAGNSFGGRTVEASDQQQGGNASANAAGRNVPTQAGSASGPAPASAAPNSSVPTFAATGDVDVTPAKVIKRVTPVAPQGVPAKTAGYVVVQFNISDAGRVSDVQVLESSPVGVFDSAAQTAVRKWMYEPRKENGVAVSSTSKARLVFEPGN